MPTPTVEEYERSPEGKQDMELMEEIEKRFKRILEGIGVYGSTHTLAVAIAATLSVAAELIVERSKKVPPAAPAPVISLEAVTREIERTKSTFVDFVGLAVARQERDGVILAARIRDKEPDAKKD